MSTSVQKTYVASAFAHVQARHLIDPLLSVIEHEDTIEAYRQQELLETLDNRFEEIVPLAASADMTEGEKWMLGLTPQLPVQAAPSHGHYRIAIEPSPKDFIYSTTKEVAMEALPDVLEAEPQVDVLPTKKVVASIIHRTAPEGFDLGPSELEESDAMLNSPKVTMLRKTVNPPALLDWLASINDLEFDKVRDELTSKSGRIMFRQLRDSLWFSGGEGSEAVRKDAADELEAVGYLVSYNRTNGTMLLELKSATLRWLAR